VASSLAGTPSAWPSLEHLLSPRTAPGSRASGRLGSRFRQVAVATFPRVVENVRGLQADETAIGAGERKGFRASVYRPAFAHGVKRDPFVPPVPLLMPAERAAHTRIAALEEIKDVLHRNSTLLAIGPRRIVQDDPALLGCNLGDVVDADQEQCSAEQACPHLKHLRLVRALAVADTRNPPDPSGWRLHQEAIAAAKPVPAPVARTARIARPIPGPRPRLASG
jgi:hypothetical protein